MRRGRLVRNILVGGAAIIWPIPISRAVDVLWPVAPIDAVMVALSGVAVCLFLVLTIVESHEAGR